MKGFGRCRSAFAGFLALGGFLRRSFFGSLFCRCFLGGGLLGRGCGGFFTGRSLWIGLLYLRLGQQAVELGLLLFTLQIVRSAAAFDDFV